LRRRPGGEEGQQGEEEGGRERDQPEPANRASVAPGDPLEGAGGERQEQGGRGGVEHPGHDHRSPSSSWSSTRRRSLFSSASESFFRDTRWVSSSSGEPWKRRLVRRSSALSRAAWR